MSAGGESTQVIVIAFLANVGIAISKFVGAWISGSASLLAEAIHSLVDCSNQILLLIGSNRSKKPADEKHPLGYGREAFFWAFVVAILLFSLGGVFAIYEGIHKWDDHGEVTSPLVGLGILIFGFVLEAYSFMACLKQVRSENTHGNLWQWFRHTRSSELLVIFTEDAAALAGLFVATVCLGLSWVTGNAHWDAIGSILIGTLLVVVAGLLAVEIKSFIIGEAPSDHLKHFVIKEVNRLFPGGSVLNFIAIQTGSNEIMMSCKIHPGEISQVSQAIALVNQLERTTKSEFHALRWQFVELDYEK